MGGQACVFYGGAEFSRDLDLILLLEENNLKRLGRALEELQARRIAVPEMGWDVLARGHAVHFRCEAASVAGLRIDLMSRLRGVAPFEELWARRTTIEVEGEEVEIVSLRDLARAKKTQREKDWPMIRRLVEESYFSAVEPVKELIEFWLMEMRTPDLLVEVARRYVDAAHGIRRRAVELALRGDVAAVEAELEEERRREREADKLYWAPLVKELELMRRQLRGGGG
jgi:predicted nucleotidyltransferase